MRSFLLPTIVILPDEGNFLLFRPETGTLLHLNPAGAWLCGKLMQGLDVSELPALLHAAGAPETALQEAETFLTSLREKNLLMGENGEGRGKVADFFRHGKEIEFPAGLEEWDDSPLYDIAGMQGEFSGRESLRSRPLDRKDFAPGDIVIFEPGRSGCAGKVRRVVGRRRERLIVSGDSEKSVREEIPAAECCELVTEKLYPGNLRSPVARKWRGMVRHWSFFGASALAVPAEKTMEFLLPLMVWRRSMALINIHGERWFCYHRKRIALVTEAGVRYFSSWDRLFYRISPLTYHALGCPKEFCQK